MLKHEELHFWGALAASACAALIGVGVLSPPYDKWLLGAAAVSGAIAAFNISPPEKKQ